MYNFGYVDKRDQFLIPKPMYKLSNKGLRKYASFLMKEKDGKYAYLVSDVILKLTQEFFRRMSLVNPEYVSIMNKIFSVLSMSSKCREAYVNGVSYKFIKRMQNSLGLVLAEDTSGTMNEIWFLELVVYIALYSKSTDGYLSAFSEAVNRVKPLQVPAGIKSVSKGCETEVLNKMFGLFESGLGYDGLLEETGKKKMVKASEAEMCLRSKFVDMFLTGNINLFKG